MWEGVFIVLGSSTVPNQLILWFLVQIHNFHESSNLLINDFVVY
jgi:hypothetical protein